MPNPCAPRANMWSSDDRPAADQSAWRPSTILTTENEPLLAAPFHSVVAYEWDRYLP
ncbi:MAG TPA: hypothetical protein VGF51_07190 [Acidimicrobiales bacterium]